VSALQRALISEAVGREVLRDVAETLASARIVAMPLKGVWLQACVYRDPGARAITDVDLLVPEGDYARALSVLAARGWRARGWNVSETALYHPRWPLPVDLHRRLFTRGAFRLSGAALFARGTPDSNAFGVQVVLPDPRDVLAHLLGHFVKSRRRPGDAAATRDFVQLASTGQLEPVAAAAHLHHVGVARCARYVLRDLAARGSEFYARLLEALPPDPLGDMLASAARLLAARTNSRSVLGALPGFLLDHSLAAGVTTLLRRVGDLPLERAMRTNPTERGL
jgi:hypothetical protein